MEKKDYSPLFTPFKIGKMEIKNRLVLSPMGHNASLPYGAKSDWEIDYFEERARGGVGMIITGCTPLTEKIAQGSHEGTLDSDIPIPAYTDLVERVHRWGAKICLQMTPGTGRNGYPNEFGDKLISSCEQPTFFKPDVLTREMTRQEIKDLQETFKYAAGVARDAGFDAIEIHAHAGYLIDQFMSKVFNHRTDEYGGSAENRTRFAREMVEAVRSVVGPDMPILFRIALDHGWEGGRTFEESKELVEWLQKCSIDAFDVDAGSYERLDYIFPPSYQGPACMSYVCDFARENISKPILNGGTHDPDTALDLITSGKADFAILGRALIADPDIPNKLLAGHREDVRPCLRCNEDCIGRIWNRRTKISCSVNTQVGEERAFKIEKTNDPKNIVIIGAGPSGLEAARVAALKGHKVTIYEKDGHLGGTARVIATSSFKNYIRALFEYYAVQMDKLGVEIHLNTEIKADDPVLEAADWIFVSTGTVPVCPPIPGLDGKNVFNMYEVHKDHGLVKGDNIVICGGGESGCDGGYELALDYGKNVTIVEMADIMAKDAMFINRDCICAKMTKLGVRLMTKTKVLSVDENGVTVEKEDGSTEYLPADTVINALGMKPRTELVDALKAKYYTKTIAMGDSVKMGKIGTAVRSGFFAAMSIDR